MNLRRPPYRQDESNILYDIWSDNIIALSNRTNRDGIIYDLNGKFIIKKYEQKK